MDCYHRSELRARLASTRGRGGQALSRAFASPSPTGPTTNASGRTPDKQEDARDKHVPGRPFHCRVSGMTLRNVLPLSGSALVRIASMTLGMAAVLVE